MSAVLDKICHFCNQYHDDMVSCEMHSKLSMSDKIDVADHIHHIPTGEDWVVKKVDGSHVEPAGWPSCRAKLADCRLIKKATTEQREEMKRLTL